MAFDSASGPEGARSCSRPDDNACPNHARRSRAEQTRKTDGHRRLQVQPKRQWLLLAYNQWLLLAYMLFRMAIRRSLTAPHAQPRFSWRPRVSKAAASALQHVTGLHFQPIQFIIRWSNDIGSLHVLPYRQMPCPRTIQHMLQ